MRCLRAGIDIGMRVYGILRDYGEDLGRSIGRET
jgi:hypothetical protein